MRKVKKDLKVFEENLDKARNNISEPEEEAIERISGNYQPSFYGNCMRRCPSYTSSKDLQKLYDGINRILDRE